MKTYGLILLLALSLTGCHTDDGFHVNLIVPPPSARIGVLPLNQKYTLATDLNLTAMNTGNAQPEIHYTYDTAPTANTADGEAFLRVPFGIDATTTELVTVQDPDDPTQTDTEEETVAVPADWQDLTLPAGTQIDMSLVEIYTNSHVYHGRVLSAGKTHNTHIMVVVPIGDAGLPPLDKVQWEDSNYLTPLGPPRALATRP